MPALTNPPNEPPGNRPPKKLGKNILDWFDERLPLRAIWRAYFTGYHVPKNLNFWYFFGSLALVVLVMQVVTGVFLAMFYLPDASLNASELPIAFARIEFIMQDVPWGWLIRYMHTTGASAFFVILYLHIFRGLLYGSYRKPRELLWIIGLFIFFFLLVESFTGQVLPWGQASYWSANVIVNLIASIPGIGDSLALWISGDLLVSGVLLNRLFSLHVIAIPLVVIALVIVHLLALHEVGANNPDGTSLDLRPNAQGISPDGVAFFPYFVIKDLLAIIVFFIIFVSVVFFFPDGSLLLDPNNLSPADPLNSPEFIRPAWYFAPFYSIMTAMVWDFFGIAAPFWGLLAVSVSFLMLLILPWLDKSPVTAFRYRGFVSRLALALFVIAFLLLGFLGTQAPFYGSQLCGQLASFMYFAFFLLMPWWSKTDAGRKNPERPQSAPKRGALT